VIVPLEKPGTPEELIHFGVRGMKWGVRKSQSSGSSGSASNKMSTKKKVAIGVGATVVVAGIVATTYILNKNGKLPLSSIGKSGGKVYKNIDAIPKPKVSEIAKARRSLDREQYIKMMMSSKKYAPTLKEATRIATETYSRL
jgi:hypothetical protein